VYEGGGAGEAIPVDRSKKVVFGICESVAS